MKVEGLRDADDKYNAEMSTESAAKVGDSRDRALSGDMSKRIGFAETALHPGVLRVLTSFIFSGGRATQLEIAWCARILVFDACPTCS